MENVKGAPIDGKRQDNPPFPQASRHATPVALSTPRAVDECINLLSSGRAVVLCQRVATLRPELLLDATLCTLDASIYRDTGQVAEVGFGSHADLRLPSRCTTDEAVERVKDFASRTLPRSTLVTVEPSEITELALLSRHWQPRVYAAFAFAPRDVHAERPLSTLWSSFGGAYALIPQLTYVQVQGASYLCYLVTATPHTAGASDDASEHNAATQPGVTVEALLNTALERLRHAEHALSQLGGNSPRAVPRAQLPEANLDTKKAAWAKHVNHALEAIGQGEFGKVVAARVAEHPLEHPLSLVNVLYTLGDTHRDSTKFAFRGPHATFLGATPEHLISKFGQTLTTEALAGTTASEDGISQAFTPKEYHEHSPVLDAILESLEPFCRELKHELTPLPLRLPHVFHLRTAISGVLERADTHVLDLVRALHPTPAVAGAPRHAALRWLAEHEDFERGWYAGPVGWFDAQGDGQFDVALRCGVLTDERALLFAGAGIVSGSIVDNEFEETLLKLKAMQTALTAAPPSAQPEAIEA